MDTARGFSEDRARPSLPVLGGIVLLHAAVLYGLIRAFAPDLIPLDQDAGFAAFDLTPPRPSPSPTPTQTAAAARAVGPPEDAAGAQGDPGERAKPREVAAPEPPIPLPSRNPAPRAASTGDANRSGAADAGEGTGASGEGSGTGAGGNGQGGGGGGVVTQPVLTRWISDVSAFGIPPGGRAARVGTRTIVALEVSAQGRVTDCRVTRSSGFPETDAKVCELSATQIRFEPARDAAGNPVPSRFLYQQRYFERRGN
ncbi:TonB family protein [Citromicrobium bathyomarinum]|uniref:energy transducer TonB n=1 Tax=unclassified Citromicrobium TaxID=2630544 RepID=UPI0006C8FAC5|nr:MULTISPECIES: TonB family protein [unclassified Citromicrobium]KPM24629.1 hypothetical protein AAJ72_02440 [Citromicrobium sp. RCC1885]KPM27871.1 hypothetical protein AAJ74_03185 [Citromicrobium sp. RCC1878]OAM10627.1 hypothetical protein A0U43_06230 [Citromicrobium sp. RCC1897]|tara:strand:+ start:1907 stop:2674 length:768 start_codon:yes stop_codon:yes gene_type:complete